jgi:chromosome segregation ATPase
VHVPSSDPVSSEISNVLCAQHISAITRKRIASKAIERLEESNTTIKAVKEGLVQLAEYSAQCDSLIEAEHETTTELQAALDRSNKENERLLARISNLENQVTEDDSRLQDLTSKSKCDDDLRRNLEATVTKLSDDVLAFKDRAQLAEEAQQAMTVEHAQALQEMHDATAQGRSACTELADAHARAASADEACARSQQVLRCLSLLESAIAVPSTVSKLNCSVQRYFVALPVNPTALCKYAGAGKTVRRQRGADGQAAQVRRSMCNARQRVRGAACSGAEPVRGMV